MKLPDYGQADIIFEQFTHNRPFDPAYNPGRPSKMPTHFGPTGKRKMEKVMHEFKEGELNIGKSDKKVTSRAQAIAIGLKSANKAEGRSRKRKK